ncbi:MAG: NUDIX hydrolase [Anaerolineae bacterium]|jgi:8-oxo-dGTP pyrophosphatase MutT (NUDIX family)|nr:CoA pyrophosphatase [Chloroflexota bacterium]
MLPQPPLGCQGLHQADNIDGAAQQANVKALRAALSGPLPGVSAQQHMAVSPRSTLAPGAARASLTPSAVLALLYPHKGNLWLPLIERSRGVATHPGEMGLPGGHCEQGDASLWDTALRETQEEIGVDILGIERLGALTELVIPVSRHVVQPFVGWFARRPEFVLEPGEVDALIEFPVRTLLDPDARRVEEWQLPGRHALVPCFRIDGRVVWGATAMILGELAVVLRRAGIS